MDIYLPESVKKVLSRLEESGFEAYIVGGCVRDSLLKKKPYDFDITTSALPEQVIYVFEGYPVIETGLKHGTVTAVIDNMPLEITTYRIDGVYTDNRRPDSVTFTRNLKEDLSRRDFTVNAMAYSEKDGLIDYFDGSMDLEEGIIRCVGDPDKRFNEDALRIVRALRFSSVLSFKIESQTSESIIKNKNLLFNIAKERITVELVKLLCGSDAEKIILEYTEVLGVIIPDIMPMKGFNQNNINHIYDVLTHTAKVVSGVPAEPALRLTALFHDIGKPESYSVDKKGVGHFYGHPKKSYDITRRIMNELKFDNYTLDKVCTLVLNHDIKPPENEKAMKRLLCKLSEPVVRDLLKIRRADTLAQNPKFIERLKAIDEAELLINKIIAENQCFSLKMLAVNGKDLIDSGITDGKRIGDTLKLLLDMVIDGKIKNNKQELIKEALSYNKLIKSGG